ncbi:TonB-dependent receptor [Caenimonas sp. SL110]|uniref:TonB-dependent receptor n=1 Tax=Caenimonas sp. SL110 TaxID=1450524 RepID=UPI0006529117|nr:TonB-dependent receptor [Caenimonas sp. SL110]
MQHHFSRGALAAALTLAFSHAQSQTQNQSPVQATLAPVTVTGNPLGSNDLIAPAAQYSGTGLLLRSQSTLGETLSATPGVSSTYFGPNASRPVIRGLDGDRVRILSNSGATVDASGLSFDHAVTADPISIERIEVLRGPAALLYGGSAVGGVVNVIDNRIPRQPVDGVTGRADVGFATANRERGGGVMVEGGNQRVALHVDVFDRRTSDVRVPASLACAKDGALTFANRICNSASHARGGAAGASVFFDAGYLGVSASSYGNDYGTVAEDAVTIGMRSNRYAIEGELRDLSGLLRSVKAQASHTDYRHVEYESAVPGTRFASQGNDLRLEARHAKLGALEGVIGFQAESARFAADGEEAFAPYSRTRQTALFAHEELATGWGKLTFGARVEDVRVESLGNPAVARFAPAARQFNPRSFAAGALFNLSPSWQLTSNLSVSERAPKDYELFADGPHIATAAYEIGDANLRKERSTNIDLGAQWKSGHDQFKVNAFHSRFANFISLASTGSDRDVDGELLPEFAYTQVRAQFRGLEVSGTRRLIASANTLDLEVRGDVVRATNLDSGEALPRIAPWRAGATLVWTQGPFSARAGFDHFARQSRVPAGDVASPGYTLVTAAASWRVQRDRASLLWYVRLDNATDRLAYSATSILTQTAPGKAPLPGRSVKVGLRADF